MGAQPSEPAWRLLSLVGGSVFLVLNGKEWGMVDGSVVGKGEMGCERDWTGMMEEEGNVGALTDEVTDRVAGAEISHTEDAAERDATEGRTAE